MRFSAATVVAAAFVAPVLAARTWDVNWVNGVPQPQVLNISAGDTVRWPNNDGPDHAIVQTANGARSCNNLAGGFNSGTLTRGQAYNRTFNDVSAINYKDGVGNNCQSGGQGTINVQANGTLPSTTNTPSPSPTHGSAANLIISVEKSIFVVTIGFLGALLL
ncbi:hypothetical protein BGW38_007856 [Lunasporangiospora selenospora]|uniref:Phytocyanin domain-containing protein n=1 Tax=Lunasporangiospora selenospora TaxID=979761 RepID=A0A9P6K9U9_9FUNG|nr:hypothetical protein BGW38_007856 [Lunasporangiospora selenospora]